VALRDIRRKLPAMEHKCTHTHTFFSKPVENITDLTDVEYRSLRDALGPNLTDDVGPSRKGLRLPLLLPLPLQPVVASRSMQEPLPDVSRVSLPLLL